MSDSKIFMRYDEFSEEALASINAIKAAFFDLLGRENFTQRALKEMAKSLGAEFASYQLYDHSMQNLIFEESSKELLTASLDKLPFGDTIQQVPELKYLNGISGVYSDPLVEARSHETRLASQVELPVGVGDVIYSLMQDKSGLLHLLAICHSNSDFRELDGAMVHHLFPTFIKSYKCNRLIADRLRDIQDTPPLTTRELEVLYLIADGKTNSDIGRELAISGRTVDKHCSNIFDKMGFENRNVAIRYVLDQKTAQFYGSEA